MEVFRQLKDYYWSHRKMMFISILFLALSTAVGLVYPYLIKYLIDDVIRPQRFELVPRLALLVVLVMAVKATFQYLHGFLGGRLGNRVAFSQAVLTGRTAPELARRSAAAAEIQALKTEFEALLPA